MLNQIETNEKINVLVEKIKSLLSKHELRVRSGFLVKYDSVQFKLNYTEYGMKINKDSVVLVWDRPYQPEKTYRTYSNVQEALMDLDRCLKYHNFLRYS